MNGEVGGRERRDYHVDIATALEVRAVWKYRPTRIQRSVSETLAKKKDPIIYCPVKAERNLIAFGYLY